MASACQRLGNQKHPPCDRDSLTADQRAAILQSSVQRVAEMPGVAAVSTQGYGRLEDDQVSLVVAEATLLAVTMIASLVPAYRATKADPVEVLRAT